jgi:hypothetical protein
MARAEAFVALYEAEARPVLVFLARRTLDAEVAVDLTAETDGGHGILPVGGCWMSPLVAVGSPHGWPSDLATVLS